ncbi:hypothetical protein [Streptomyces sp. NPDC056479]|uniref:hypothetical protein n=1 Tax=unclassified Streptomyces TaxID=2593676 RepID=UPI0036A8A6F7
MSAADFDALPLKVVADAATEKRDYHLLAWLPDTVVDDRDGQAVDVFRLYICKGGQYSNQFFLLSRVLRHALTGIAECSPIPSPMCGDVFRRAAELDLPQ